jgi:hypothetical protein
MKLVVLGLCLCFIAGINGSSKYKGPTFFNLGITGLLPARYHKRVVRLNPPIPHFTGLPRQYHGQAFRSAPDGPVVLGGDGSGRYLSGNGLGIGGRGNSNFHVGSLRVGSGPFNRGYNTGSGSGSGSRGHGVSYGPSHGSGSSGYVVSNGPSYGSASSGYGVSYGPSYGPASGGHGVVSYGPFHGSGSSGYGDSYGPAYVSVSSGYGHSKKGHSSGNVICQASA